MDVRGFADWIYKRDKKVAPAFKPVPFDSRFYVAIPTDDGYEFYPVNQATQGFVFSGPATILMVGEKDAKRA